MALAEGCIQCYIDLNGQQVSQQLLSLQAPDHKQQGGGPRTVFSPCRGQPLAANVSKVHLHRATAMIVLAPWWLSWVSPQVPQHIVFLQLHVLIHAASVKDDLNISRPAVDDTCM